MTTSEFEHLWRDLAPQVLAAVLRRHHDFAAAEDAVQESFAAASQQWPRDGVPEHPKAWLIQVAIRRLTDQIRADSARRRREAESGYPMPSSETNLDSAHDDTLILLFMCCHPSLTPSSAIALTLRAVGGLTTLQIANAFLVPEPTMAQRISRAKQTIKSSKIPFRLPTPVDRAARLRQILHVLYLIFNEGYSSTTGESTLAPELSNEAIRLTRVVHKLLPDDPEVTGLLALMLLTDARRPARTGPLGELIPLTEQNRTLWNRDLISEGIALISAALPKGNPGPYQIQAAIAAVHNEAVRAEDTDWPQILALYDILASLSDNPMVKLNRAVALAMVEGPAAGLEALDPLDRDPHLAAHYRLDAVRAHLFERIGDIESAIHHYNRAARATTSLAERNYLLTQSSRLR